MFISPDPDAAASTVPPTHNHTPPRIEPTAEPIRHMLFGSPSAVRTTIWTLHKLGYAEPNDWSLPITTGKPNEVMAILTKRLTLEP